MECIKCKKIILESVEREHNREIFCEDCYIEVLSPAKFSDPFISKNKITPSSIGELDGLSFATKDNIDVANEITGYGSPAWMNTHSKPVVNAICLEQLLNAGGNYQGKTKSDELAYSLIGVNSFYGTPLNPKAPDRVPGGSSSGSASAVASKLVDFAIGTDTGGSIRVPASNCGVWGYRPSHGAISVSGVLALAPSFDTVGIIAQTGEILGTVMGVLLAENYRGGKVSSSVCFIDDVFQMSDRKILDKITPGLNKISEFYEVQTLNLAQITDPHVNCDWLFEQLGFLLSTEIWNTFGTWIKNKNPKLSSGVDYIFTVMPNLLIEKIFKLGSMQKKHFKTKLTISFVKAKYYVFLRLWI